MFERLPGLNEGYTGNDPSIWLSAYWDELFIQSKQTIDLIPVKQLIPLQCDPPWLDFLAPLFGWDGLYWNPVWTVDAKRQLLHNSYSGMSIWENKGTLETLSFVLTTIGIRNYIRVDGDFIIGTNTVGDEIGYQPWEYTIYLPPSYQGTDKYRECLKIDELFGPCYCVTNIIYDYERFLTYELLTTEDGEVIATENDEALLGGESDGGY